MNPISLICPIEIDLMKSLTHKGERVLTLPFVGITLFGPNEKFAILNGENSP